MTSQKIADGTIHKLPADFRKAIEFDATATSVWADITPLARNEWICWVTSAKQEATSGRDRERACAGVEDNAVDFCIGRDGDGSAIAGGEGRRVRRPVRNGWGRPVRGVVPIARSGTCLPCGAGGLTGFNA